MQYENDFRGFHQAGNNIAKAMMQRPRVAAAARVSAERGQVDNARVGLLKAQAAKVMQSIEAGIKDADIKQQLRDVAQALAEDPSNPKLRANVAAILTQVPGAVDKLKALQMSVQDDPASKKALEDSLKPVAPSDRTAIRSMSDPNMRQEAIDKATEAEQLHKKNEILLSGIQAEQAAGARGDQQRTSISDKGVTESFSPKPAVKLPPPQRPLPPEKTVNGYRLVPQYDDKGTVTNRVMQPFSTTTAYKRPIESGIPTAQPPKTAWSEIPTGETAIPGPAPVVPENVPRGTNAAPVAPMMLKAGTKVLHTQSGKTATLKTDGVLPDGFEVINEGE